MNEIDLFKIYSLSLSLSHTHTHSLTIYIYIYIFVWIVTWLFNCLQRIIIIIISSVFIIISRSFPRLLSIDCELPQVSKDSSQYSGWPQQCYSLDGFSTSSDFQFFQSPYQSFGDCSKPTNYNWYYRHPYVPQFFSFPSSFSHQH